MKAGLKDDDVELDQLLARGRLSGTEYDQIEQRVLEHAVPRRARWLWPTLLPAAALASAFAVWFLVVTPERPAADSFTPRSAGTSLSSPIGLLELGCVGREPGVCRLGDTLMFSLNGNTVSGFMGAYAERVGEPSAARIWYFPTADGTAPRLEAQSGTLVADQGVRLGPPHAPGQYQVTVWISETPLERAHAQPTTLARQSSRLEILP
jgi:hypothetical protein